MLSLILAATVNLIPSAPERGNAGPIPDEYPFAYEAQDGLLLRDGKPHFWFGDGSQYSAYSSSPVGLWLAKLQGIELVTQCGARGASDPAVVDRGASVDVGTTSAPGYYSWFRENVRMGMLTESPAGWPKPGRNKGVDAASKAHPEDFGEAVYDRGHHMGVDPLAKDGREIILHKRKAWFDKLENHGRAIAELTREPGPDPFNNRVREGFRTWLKRKYGDLRTLNEVWGKSYADWSEVLPAHLTPERKRMKRVAADEARRRARREEPARYHDWNAYMIDDTFESNRAETEDLRKNWTRWVTGDTRSHQVDDDSYMMYSPERLDSLWDVFFVHQGWTPVRYSAGCRYDEQTLVSESAFPLLCFNFYRSNLTRPIVSAENITSRIGRTGESQKAMERNDIARFHEAGWEFQLAKKPQDGAWRPIRVPGCWDEMPEWKGRSGTGWYRRRFTVPASYRNDYEDGSRKFYVYGQGVAQKGDFWLNGEEIGKLTGRAWNAKYKFDVGRCLRYGGENEILIRVHGTGEQNGIRQYIHLLAGDMIVDSTPTDEQMHRHMIWSFMMGGLSGDLHWNWDARNPLRPFLPGILAKVNAVAPFVLPAVRRGHDRVALLYPYLYYRGLPFHPRDPEYAEPVKMLDALTFLGSRPSVLGESRLEEKLAAGGYTTLIVPEARIVEDSTYAAVKRFLADGGTVVLSGAALERTTSLYRPTDVGRLEASAGKGRVVRIGSGLGLEALMETLKPFVGENALKVLKEPRCASGERALVERMLVGDAERKIVYLNNWGGDSHRMLLGLPEELKDWTLTVLEGAFSKRGCELAAEVGSQDVAVALLERPGAVPCATGVRPAVAAAFARLERLMAPETVPFGTDVRKKVLFPDENIGQRDAFGGGKLYPCWVEAFKRLGARVDIIPRDDWNGEMLARYDVVMIPESYSASWSPVGGAEKFEPVVRKYVENGGTVCAFINKNGIANNDGKVVGAVAGLIGLGWEKGVALASSGFSFGDARQIVTGGVSGPLAEGVKEVQLYTLTPFRKGKSGCAEAVLTLPESCGPFSGAPVMACGACGKGRVFVSAEAMAFQPLRIEERDNAALLMNIVGWLLGRKVGTADREGFAGSLFLRRGDFVHKVQGTRQNK